MKSFVSIIISSLLWLFFVECGEDRTYEYEEKTERDHWILDVMKEKYLWGDSIKEENIDWKKFFSDPSSFLTSVTSFAPVKDSWSWCSVDTVKADYHQRGYFNHVNSYGIDFVVMTDPTGATTRQYARVTFVADNSPAKRCGLKRGDFIGYVDDAKFTTSLTEKLVKGGKRKLEVSRIEINDEGNEYVWGETETINMERSEYVEDVAFPVCKSFKVGDNNVGYLMVNRLTPGPEESDEESSKYLDMLDDCILQLKKESPNLMIVDVRFCNYGNIDMANRLASYMLGTAAKSEVFANVIYNKNRSDENKSYLFDSQALDNALNPTDVFFITSEYTSGPAEWVIRALYDVLGEEHVFVIGNTTAGQNVITEDIPSSYYVTLHPAVAYVADKNGDYDYSGGIAADQEVNENLYIYFYPFGNEKEAIVDILLSQIEISF